MLFRFQLFSASLAVRKVRLYSGHLSPRISQLQKSGSPRQNFAETVLAGFERAIATRNQQQLSMECI